MSRPRFVSCTCILTASIAAQGPQFAELAQRQLPTDRQTATAVVAGDLDADGDQDLIIGGPQGSPVIHLNSAGVFRRSPDQPAQTTPFGSYLALADVDLDLDLDLIAGSGFLLELFRNDGAGRLTADPTLPTPGNRQLGPHVFEDIDGDLDPDLIIPGKTGAEVWTNDGTGTFTRATTLLTPGTDANAATFGDLDGDGLRDLVLATQEGNEVYLRTGPGQLTRSPAAMPRIRASRNSVATVDFDLDGDLDVITGGANAHAYENDGAGFFVDVSSRWFGFLSAPLYNIHIADLNADGRPDLLGQSDAGTLFLRHGNLWFLRPITITTEGGSTLVFDPIGPDRPHAVVVTARDARHRMLAFVDNEFVDLTASPGIPSTQIPFRLASTTDDLNGDGLPDAVLTTVTDHEVWLQQPNGFDAVPSSRLPPFRNGAIATTDIDQDGDRDIVFGAVANSPTVVPYTGVLINNGLGAFNEETFSRLGTVQGNFPIPVELDGDGAEDLILSVAGKPTAFRNQNGVYVSDPTTVIGAYPLVVFPRTAAAFFDADGDGDLDAVSQTGILVHNGAAAATVGEWFSPGWTAPFPIREAHAADVDGDGDVDFFAGTPNPRLMLNDGTGNFTDATASRLPSVTASWILTAQFDVDGDGDPDALMVDSSARTLEWLENDGTGTFTVAAGRSSPVPPWFELRAIGDFDRDGDIDFMTREQTGFTERLALVSNLTRQLDIPHAPRIGGSLDLEVHLNDGGTSSLRFALPFLSTNLTGSPTTLPSFGTWYLPDNAFQLPLIAVPGPSASVSHPLPATPTAIGHLSVQALFVVGFDPGEWRLSNVVRRRLLP